MSKINAKTLELRLNKAESVYRGTIGDVEAMISDFVYFDYSILYQESDGFVLLNADTADLAPVDLCLKAIQDGQLLTSELHKTFCI